MYLLSLLCGIPTSPFIGFAASVRLSTTPAPLVAKSTGVKGETTDTQDTISESWRRDSDMAIRSWTLEEKAKLVAEMLPGHTLSSSGKVVKVEVCRLCEKPLDDWTESHSVKLNGEWVKVHSLCPSERFE